MQTDDFWVITSYFNPAGYQRRSENFRRFRERLGAPLIVAEMSNNGRFEVEPDEQTVVVRLTEGDVMWQKEALLNVALDHLPANAKYVAWLDCDVMLEDAGWREKARAALAQSVLVQLFSELHDLPQSGAWDRHSARTGESIAALHVQGPGPRAVPKAAETNDSRGTSYGLAWAACADLMRKHRFYDAAIIGGGDRTLICAALGCWQDAVSSLQLLPAQTAHYEAWARPFYEAVKGRVGFIPGRIFHLWHGDIADRRYTERHSRLAALSFDPAEDLVRDANGLWKWSPQRLDAADFMAEYFASRLEDGRVAS